MRTIAYMKSALKSGLILMLMQTAAIQAETTVTNVAAGGWHSLFLKSDGSAWGMGIATNRPKQLVSSGVIEVAGGNVHSLFLKSDSSLWGMSFQWDGWNYIPGVFRVVSNGVVALARGCNNAHMLFIKSDGSLWGMGYNYYGQLGDGTFNDATNPVQIMANGVLASAAGAGHSLFVGSNGSLWATGRNDYGQLGNGTTNLVNTPEQIVSSGVTAVAAGNFHSLFLKSDGSLWGMGANALGQLGDGTRNNISVPEQVVSNNVIAIACGGAHSLFIKSDGSLWAMGYDGSGQLGDGGAANKPPLFSTNRPVRIVTSGVIAIAAGVDHSLFARVEGSLWTMGLNDNGQLGDGFPNLSAPGVWDHWSAPEQIVPSPQPLLTISITSKTNVQFKATCQFGGLFYLLTRANLSQPMNQWTRVRTNSVTARGTNNYTETITNAVNLSIGQQFYILQSQ
jgi:alpha-tubulin suppressor-like RCC1 family protein